MSRPALLPLYVRVGNAAYRWAIRTFTDRRIAKARRIGWWIYMAWIVIGWMVFIPLAVLMLAP